MQLRRGFLFMFVTGFVAMVFVGTVIAEDLLGVISKVDVEGKKVIVIEKDTELEIVVKITDKTEQVSKKKGEDEPTTVKLDSENLEKLSKKVEGAKVKGRKGLNAKITHEKGVASKIELKGGRGKKRRSNPIRGHFEVRVETHEPHRVGLAFLGNRVSQPGRVRRMAVGPALVFMRVGAASRRVEKARVIEDCVNATVGLRVSSPPENEPLECP